MNALLMVVNVSLAFLVMFYLQKTLVFFSVIKCNFMMKIMCASNAILVALLVLALVNKIVLLVPLDTLRNRKPYCVYNVMIFVLSVKMKQILIVLFASLESFLLIIPFVLLIALKYLVPTLIIISVNLAILFAINVMDLTSKTVFNVMMDLL